MNKNYRLFVKNLPTHTNEEKIKNLFQKYVTVSDTNLKEKSDLNNKISKFAFVNISTTDKQLQVCFEALNGKNIDGFEISVELAKESFLERLKKERNENKGVQIKDSAALKPEKTNSPIKLQTSLQTTFKSKQKFFFDADSLDTDYDIQKKDDKNLCAKFKTIDQNKPPVLNTNFQTIEDIVKEVDDLSHPKKDSYMKKNENDFYLKKPKDNKTFQNNTIHNLPNQLQSSQSLKKINKSEKKRLMSVKQKKKIFRAQEQAIRNALKDVDNTKQDNRIIFDDNIDFKCKNNESDKTSVKNEKKNLFEDEDEDEDFHWNDDELEAKSNLKKKLLKLQTNIGNDKRFILDERFIDDNDNSENNEENINSIDPIDEKKWQLDILGNILGKPIINKFTDTNERTKRNSRMIRYDPSANNHQEFEIKVQEPEPEKRKKKKQKIFNSEEKNPDPIPVSNEVFYQVSDTLAESLNKSEGFSILKSVSQTDSFSDGSKNNSISHQDVNEEQGFKFNLNTKNPFKYDSSDNEADDIETNTAEKTYANENIDISKKNDRLFFVFNDSRFCEAEEFFKNQSTTNEDTFQDRRRELKEIVRSKVRNNLKKVNTPWNKKKIRKLSKK